MKNAEIYSVSGVPPHGYVWKWRSPDGKIMSKEAFVFYFDCVTNARSKGYVIALGDKAADAAREWQLR